MYHLALKMLVGDRAKYLMLVSGLTFASLQMTCRPQKQAEENRALLRHQQ